MVDKWIVQNQSGTVLILPKNKMRFTVGGRVDLVERLGRSVGDLEVDKEIAREISYNNLVTIEKYNAAKEGEKQLADKMDAMISLLQGGAPAPQSPAPPNQIIEAILSEDKLAGLLDKYFKDRKIAAGEDPDGFSVVDEEKLRQEAMKKMVDRNKTKETHLDGFGGDSVEVEVDDDHVDLIDF